MALGELPELMSVDDVARWLRKSPKAVRRMRERGKLPAPIRHIDVRALMWRRADLVQWFSQSRTRAPRSAR